MKLAFLCSLLCCIVGLIPNPAYAQPQKYTINGQISSLKDNDKVYLIYQVDDKQVTDSAIIRNKKFQFQGSLTYPVYGGIYLNLNPYVTRVPSGQNLDYIRFYLEPSVIELRSEDSLKNAAVNGSETDQLNRQLQARLKQNNEQFAALNREFEALPQEKQRDSLIFQRFIEHEKQLLQDSYEIHLAFVNEHPDAYLSVISLSHIAAQPAMTERAAKAYARLPARLKQTPLGKGIALQLSAPENTKLGKPAPEFEQLTPEGKKVKLSDFRNQYVLIDFWASWCGPCRQENPNIVKAYNRWKNKGFTILGVSLDAPGQKDAWLKAIKDDHLNWTQVSDLRGWDNEAAKMYGVRSIPANFLVGPDGKILGRNLRGEALIAELEKLLN